MSLVSAGERVLVIWGGQVDPATLQNDVQSLKDTAGSSGKIQMENIDMLRNSSHAASSFDVALCGTLCDVTVSSEVLEEVCRMLKPRGCLVVKDGSRTQEKLGSLLTLSGFVNVSQTSGGEGRSVTALKPGYEVGASTQLSFAKNGGAAAAWTLSSDDLMDDDVDTIDTDALLQEADLKRPDAAALRADCGTDASGKKKACKDCSCGLAEELAGEEKTTPKSSCGSCYLGDAFRCSTCPYLGMPAFTPGQKVMIPDTQLKADA